MAKRPPERYEPGELERTRRNLGAFSADEAKKLSELLGGEIGSERTAEHVDQQYRRLQKLNRRRADRVMRDTGTVSTNYDGIITSINEGAGSVHGKVKYRDRVRMDFTAAKPEYEIKTLAGAIKTLLSPIISSNDYINPRFIVHSDRIFFRRIEDLVTSVRGLLALNRRHPVNRLKHSFYRTILETIKRWDVEGMHAELARLQIAPRRLTFRYCGTLARQIFIPIMLMSEIDAAYHVKGALKRVYDLDILSLPKRHPDIERVKHYYHRAEFEAEYVFGTLRRRLYPLLMKLCCTEYIAVEQFFVQAREQLLRFLSIDQSKLITLPKPGAPEESEPEPVVVTEEEIERILEKPRNQKGIEVLERLFPRAGWDRLDEFPDLYPYLEPLYSFPRGFELVPPRDPLHQVYILISILQELFYGFRHIRFGVLQENVGAALPDAIGKIIEGWRVLRDEFVAQWYLSKLYEYCRDVERNPLFAESQYGRRSERDLLWQKKQFLLPHLTVHRGATPDIGQTIPKLGDLVSELLQYLSAISLDLAVPERQTVRSVRNPWERYEFDIESATTNRLRAVMKSYGELPNNANLLLYAYSILTMLDSLIHEESSFYYPFPTETIYRTEYEGSSTPQYIVPLLDPVAIMKEADRSMPDRREEPPIRHQPVRTTDDLTNLSNEYGLRERVEEEVHRFRNEDLTFSIIAMTVSGFDEYCETNGEESGVRMLQSIAKVIEEEIREFRDVPARLQTSLFAILLPDTQQTEAVHLAIRLIDRCTTNEAEPLPIALGLVQAHKTWSRDRAIRMATRAAERAATLPPPSISVYDERSNEFRSLSDVKE